jgi:hypothetical protein
LFARPEACLFYFYVKFTVDGVILFFICADLVGEDSVTAVTIAAWQRNERVIVKPKDDIARPPKAKRLTVNRKIAVDMA